MKQHPRLTTTIVSLAFGICFLFTMAACAPQQNADGELAFYANARSEGDSKFLDSGVLSLERGFYDETNANHVLCLNATAQPNEYCEWVTYESTNNNIQIGSTPGAWGDSVTITAEKVAEGFFLYCNVSPIPCLSTVHAPFRSLQTLSSQSHLKAATPQPPITIALPLPMRTSPRSITRKTPRNPKTHTTAPASSCKNARYKRVLQTPYAST